MIDDYWFSVVAFFFWWLNNWCGFPAQLFVVFVFVRILYSVVHLFVVI